MIANKETFPRDLQDLFVAAEMALNTVDTGVERTDYFEVQIPDEIAQKYEGFAGRVMVFDAHRAESGVLRYIFSHIGSPTPV